MRITTLLLILFTSAAAIAHPAPTVWQPVADQICEQINQALHIYQKNDLKDAHLAAVMTYFKGYDAEIEPAIRITLGGPHVFEMERNFRDFATIMTPNPDKKQIKKVTAFAAHLCQLVNEDANALNAAHVQRQVFKVE
jgi:hypothetical protein